MRFRSSYFYNFRNISAQRMTWSDGFNFIEGPNGAGKTNFLEGLSMIAGWGPLERGTKVPMLTAFGAESASMWAAVCGEDEHELFLSLSSRCALRVDDKGAPASRVRASMPVIAFLSDHVSVIRGGAEHRRALLDRVGALISPTYGRMASDFRRLLRQKSRLLRRGGDARSADRALCSVGAWLWTAREEIVRMMRATLGEFSSLLPMPIELRYVRGGGGRADDPRDDMVRSLAEHSARERAACLTLVGPQRDEIEITAHGRGAAHFMSRGQSRRAACALVLAAARAVERSLSRKPVLIFDEIASELDRAGIAETIEALTSTGCQVFAASAAPVESPKIARYALRDGTFE